MELVEGVVRWFLDPANWTGSNGVPNRVSEHLVLSGLSMAIALALALPVGLAIGHTGRATRVVIAVAGLGRAVPSYALLILSVGFLRLSIAAALPALVLLAIPPILVNTATAIRDVDRDVVEAGRAHGHVRARRPARRRAAAGHAGGHRRDPGRGAPGDCHRDPGRPSRVVASAGTSSTASRCRTTRG